MSESVYIIQQPAAPALVKVGRTNRDPHLRAKELDGTAAPLPHEVLFSVSVPAGTSKTVERTAHDLLSGCRVSKHREWFRCSPEEAREAIITACEMAIPDGKSLEESGGSGWLVAFIVGLLAIIGNIASH